ncbi:hypothetical protein GCM10027294_42570 [Marinactinospora endophytica]
MPGRPRVPEHHLDTDHGSSTVSLHDGSPLLRRLAGAGLIALLTFGPLTACNDTDDDNDEIVQEDGQDDGQGQDGDQDGDQGQDDGQDNDQDDGQGDD